MSARHFIQLSRSKSILSGKMLKPAASRDRRGESNVLCIRSALCQIKSGDAAARTAHLTVLAADDDGRAIKFLQHARGNDADDAVCQSNCPSTMTK